MPKLIDITGKKYGRLTVLCRSQEGKAGRAYWDCICECGKATTVCGDDLRSGHTKSCGCYKQIAAIEAIRTHGKSHSQIYSIWSNMMNRCVNPNYRDYHLYGGRGIEVCEEWQDAARFIEWAEQSGYVESKKRGICTLDRRDNDGNYCPENCRWVSQKVQNLNKRCTIRVSIDGVTKTLMEWCQVNGVDPKLARCRISRGWDAERAVTA